MALADHLRELRRRFVLGTLGLLVGAVVGWFLYDPVFQAMQSPIRQLQADGFNASLNFQGIATSFDIKLRVALAIGLIVSSPWWMYHLWAFISPGMTSKEKRYAAGFVGAGVPLFVGGVTMAWFALPRTVRLLTQFTPEGDAASNFIGASEYIQFVIQFVLIFGFAFMLPMIMVVLNFMGLVRGITWLRGWRWAVIVIFLIAALATPTADPVTFILQALPICLLYFVAVGLCVLRDRRVDKKRSAEQGASSAADGPGSGAAPA